MRGILIFLIVVSALCEAVCCVADSLLIGTSDLPEWFAIMPLCLWPSILVAAMLWGWRPCPVRTNTRCEHIFGAACMASSILCIAIALMWMRGLHATENWWKVSKSGTYYSMGVAENRVGLAWPHDWYRRNDLRWHHEVRSSRSTWELRGIVQIWGSLWGDLRVEREYSFRRIRIPFWLLYALAAAFPVLWCRERATRPPDWSSGFCPCCGYDLRASEGRCPECGTPIPAEVERRKLDDSATPRKVKARLSKLAVLPIVAASLGGWLAPSVAAFLNVEGAVFVLSFWAAARVLLSGGRLRGWAYPVIAMLLAIVWPAMVVSF
jgi:hypothetical protein